MNFKVGQKVVCVDDEDNSGLGGPWLNYPTKGKIYTVSAVGLTHPRDLRQLPCVLIRELDRDEDSPLWAHRFRPVVERKTDISIFTAILKDAEQRLPAH